MKNLNFDRIIQIQIGQKEFKVDYMLSNLFTVQAVYQTIHSALTAKN